ncbi:hypothetical protein CDAR_453021 [Caerostris darwini]|uniref:Secreted protein n=1 Tax=Caerostris darwini TaxID=1538125 RepID=A0AAV4VCU5_9ARAC|nr:hypothetical protein CDAR_453021 [Caerostris darwini]
MLGSHQLMCWVATVVLEWDAVADRFSPRSHGGAFHAGIRPTHVLGGRPGPLLCWLRKDGFLKIWFSGNPRGSRCRHFLSGTFSKLFPRYGSMTQARGALRGPSFA